MKDLPKQCLLLYIKFVEEGCHSIRRSNRYWVCIWTDLVLEQVLMQVFKSQEGRKCESE